MFSKSPSTYCLVLFSSSGKYLQKLTLISKFVLSWLHCDFASHLPKKLFVVKGQRSLFLPLVLVYFTSSRSLLKITLQNFSGLSFLYLCPIFPILRQRDLFLNSSCMVWASALFINHSFNPLPMWSLFAVCSLTTLKCMSPPKILVLSSKQRSQVVYWCLPMETSETKLCTFSPLLGMPCAFNLYLLIPISCHHPFL